MFVEMGSSLPNDLPKMDYDRDYEFGISKFIKLQAS